MKRTSGLHGMLWDGALLTAIVLASLLPLAAQSGAESSQAGTSASTAALEREFFSALREGNTKAFLAYVPAEGVNLGSEPQHASREEIEQQFQSHRGLYCKLFDASCIDAPIDLGNSARACSYRELLTRSDKVSTAASEVTRSGVRQAVLVARIKNDQCSNPKLIDFIFNFEADGWKLFSIP
jgi:hypothetical protein